MSTTLATAGHGHAEHDDGSMTTVGFWIYLMSDCLIFATVHSMSHDTQVHGSMRSYLSGFILSARTRRFLPARPS
jgi:heme/copper-type cytochrome/quinol oxidase subunit 3